MLSDTEEDNGGLCDGDPARISANNVPKKCIDVRRNRASTFGMTIHLRYDDCTKVSTVLEGTSLRLSSLT